MMTRSTSVTLRFAALQDALAGQYHFERELGSGGMGVVILARDVRLDRLVAIKVLPTSAEEEPALYARFLREARTAGQLSHPNIVPVFRADELGGQAFFAMPYIEGEDLSVLIERDRPLPPLDVARWLREVAWALAYAHAHGVVHRDIKPANIMIEQVSQRALVTDFGLARTGHETAPRGLEFRTAESEIVGSVDYMSPEQITGERVDGRSDLYALGVVGFHALARRLPFEGQLPAVLAGHLDRPAPPLLDVAPTVPPHLAAVIDRCLAKRPTDRWATSEALADALEKAMRLTTTRRTYVDHDARVRFRGARRTLTQLEWLASRAMTLLQSSARPWRQTTTK